jgi:hypothetical protein
LPRRRAIKLVHITGTAWLILCMFYIMAAALRQAGINWWVIFSLSGHTALLVFLLVSLYLFAIFRGVDKGQEMESEHPLTSTIYYEVLYVGTPFLGSMASCLGMVGVTAIGQFAMGIAMGTLGSTFLVWVIVDPAAGSVELLLPAGRKHRLERIAEAQARQEKRERDHQHLLADIVKREQLNQRQWEEMLKPKAEKLAGLLTADAVEFREAEREAVDIGAYAWQLGGLACMRQLHDMAMAICRNNYQDASVADYVSSWWDGVGNWRNQSYGY